MSKGKMFVISGASGVGKSTVLKQVMDGRDDLKFSVSATTRAPRPGETDGVHYYFVTRERFEEMIREMRFWNTTPTRATTTAPPALRRRKKWSRDCCFWTSNPWARSR